MDSKSCEFPTKESKIPPGKIVMSETFGKTLSYVQFKKIEKLYCISQVDLDTARQKGVNDLLQSLS